MQCPHCEGTGEVGEPGLGALMLARRKALHLTQAELSVKCGLGRSQIANIEAGRTDVPTKTLVRIAEALNCRPGDLLP